MSNTLHQLDQETQASYPITGFLLKATGWLLLTVSILIIIKEFKSYMNLLFLKKQGLNISYVPFKGIIDNKVRTSEEAPGNQSRAGFFKFYNIGKGSPGFAGNHAFTTSPLVFLNELDDIKDLFAKETKYLKRQTFAETFRNKKISFFFGSGKEAIKQRALFGTFFNYNNVKKLTPYLQECFVSAFSKLERKLKNEETPTKVDIAEYIGDAFDDIVNIILFGEIDSEDVPLIKGMKFSRAGEIYSNIVNSEDKKLYYLLTLGYSSKWRLSKKAKFAYEIWEEIKSTVTKIYKNRWNNKSQIKKNNRPTNIIDLVIEKNRKVMETGVKEDLISMDFILDCIITFRDAGSDTSQSSLQMITAHLIDHPALADELHSKLTEELFKGDSMVLSKNPTIQFDYDSSEYLNKFLAETLRIFNPVTVLFPKTALRDMKIGKLDIKKGTKIFVNPGGIHYDPELYPEPLQFKVDRKKQKNKFASMPFSAGMRQCVGQYLGEIMIKIGLVTISSKLQMQKLEGHVHKKLMRLTFGMNEVIGLAQLRS